MLSDNQSALARLQAIRDNTKRQGFDLTLPNNNNGRIFLNEDDYQIA